MRIWHKNLIKYLPRQQLISQWRECCCIARNIYKNGSPNHILVNKIMDYPDEEFNGYTLLVLREMHDRGYKTSPEHFFKYRGSCGCSYRSEIFNTWHTQRYLDQCFYNLQEKYDCGGIGEEEWETFENGYLLLKKKVRR